MPFNMAYKIEALERDLSTLASLRAHEPNSGIRLVWGFLCQGGVTPIWSSFAFHSFVRPAPRALFRPDRIFPSPSRRSGGQGRRFFSAAEGLSLTDEHGGRLPVIGWLAVR